VPVTIGVSAYLILAGVALVVGIVASIAALRRVLKVDPALAFG
jgi:putative ABC transport system permease protein